MNLFDQIARIVPRVRFYPRWAQRLFAAAFAMVLVSSFLWIVMAPAASTNAQHKSVELDVGLVGGQGHVSGNLGVTTRRGMSAAAATAQTQDALDAEVTYQLNGDAIVPNVPYLTLLRRGGPIGGVGEFDWWYGAETAPKLDVKIANTGSRTVFVTAASVHVASSTLDREPIPVVFAGTPTEPQAFSLANEGWGRMEDAVLRYDVAQGSVPAAWARGGPFLARLDANGSFQLSAGVRSRSLPRHGIGTVWGVLAYRWHDAGGAVHAERVKVVTTFYLAAGPPSVGAPAPLSGQYDVELRPSGRNYDVVLRSFDRFIKPQSPDRFAVRVHAPRSSVHRGVRVELRFSDGHRQESAPLEVRLFTPRNAPSST